VHDTVALEASGIPSVFVASSEFIEAAEAQSEALGADPMRVFVQHPIQDRTDDEMRALADSAVGPILDALLDKN
jgi:alkanesulfonate monooxygenase SsuD/methylene tetrahydromethanopterin reductase-like flavin-dependent oxidoreductase (luciferase family)